jgi:hypothetical protein
VKSDVTHTKSSFFATYFLWNTTSEPFLLAKVAILARPNGRYFLLYRGSSRMIFFEDLIKEIASVSFNIFLALLYISIAIKPVGA